MPSNPDNNNGWSEWSRFVLKELERLNTCYERLDEKLDKMNNDIISLKLKAGVWGALAGAIPVLVAILIWLLAGGGIGV